MKWLRHILTIAGALCLLVALPVFASGYPARAAAGADAAASASVVIEQPSGAYVVLINPDLHKDRENLAVWQDFFRGRDIGYLFEDIDCSVADSDAAGLDMAKSFQSRLPENQLRLKTENVTLMLSKAYYNRFDVILLSREFYDAYRPDLPEGTLIIEEDGI